MFVRNLFPILRSTTSSMPSVLAWRRVSLWICALQMPIWAISAVQCTQRMCLTVSKTWRWVWSFAVLDLSSTRPCWKWLFALHNLLQFLARGLLLDAFQLKSCCSIWRRICATSSSWAPICQPGSRHTSSPRTEASRSKKMTSRGSALREKGASLCMLLFICHNLHFAVYCAVLFAACCCS